VVLVDFDPERELFSVTAFSEPTEPELAPGARSLAARG